MLKARNLVIASLCALCISPVLAQERETVPDTTTASRYYPLEVGNRWIRAIFHQDHGFGLCPPEWTLVGYAEERIDSSLVIDGATWFRRRTVTRDAERFAAEGDWKAEIIRFDPDLSEIVLRVAPGDVRPVSRDFARPFTLDNLPQWFNIIGEYGWEGEIGGHIVNSSTFTDEPDGSHPLTYKSYENAGQVYWERYVSDVGQISFALFECGGTRTDLVYALLGGREIGELPTVVANEKPVELPPHKLIVYPNPTRDASIISLRTPQVEFVQIVVYDAVGRKVVDLVSELVSSGQSEYRLETMTLAPGVYFVSATGPSFRLTRPLVVAR